jgi:anti-sigma regulatory factor (Ser/Thr protein kinase)
MPTLTIANRVESVRPATAFLVRAARALNVAAAAEPVFEVAVSEAVANAVKHGGHGRPDDIITCDIERRGQRLRLRILNGGTGFEVPTRRPLEMSRQRIDTVPESGYGLHIIRHVFPVVRAIRVGDRFGVELALRC